MSRYHYNTTATMRRPRRPAVEAPIWMLLAVLPVEEAEAAEADDEAVSSESDKRVSLT